jgi:hypothetical protein
LAGFNYDIFGMSTKRYCPCCSMRNSAFAPSEYTTWVKGKNDREYCLNDPRSRGEWPKCPKEVDVNMCECDYICDKECDYYCFLDHDPHPTYVNNGAYVFYRCGMSDGECCGGRCQNGDRRTMMWYTMKAEAKAGRFNYRLWSLALPKESAAIAKQIKEEIMCERV